MKIGIDLRCLQEGKKSGVAEYALNLLTEILESDRSNQYVFFLNSFRKCEVDLGDLPAYANVEVRMFRYPNKLLNFCSWYLGWPKIDRMLGGTDILFLPNLNFASWSAKTKTILTVHDLSFEYYPETFSWKRRLWHFFINPKRLAQKADRIIAISDSTKNDIVALYKIDPAKIKMIHSAIKNDFQSLDRNSLAMIETAKKYQLPYNFILYLGTVEPRKNIVGLVRAYNLLRGLRDPELEKFKLVIAGTIGWKSKKIFAEIEKSPFSQDILVAGTISEEDLPAVYNLASLFVYPSFFEGFGFPPLEAMACNVPVITSNCSSLPEIAGGAGIMIDPDKPDEIFQAMKEILLNRDFSDKLRSDGLEQAKKFSWQKTAGEFLALLDKI